MKEAGFDEIRRMIREDDPPQPSDRISTLGEAAATISTHRKTEPAKLSGLLRRDLDWIVMKALEKDRTRRYQTASDFARDIQRYLADEPIEARRPTLRDRVAKWGRRHRTIVSTATVFLLGGAAAAVFLSIVMLISKGEGTVKLEFADNTVARQCAVSIDGDDIRIDNLGAPIKLRAGKHQLRIRQGDLEIETREFDILRNGTQVLHVSIPVRGADAVAPSAEPPFDAKQAQNRQERWARESGLPVEFTNSIGMKLVLIPPGEFEMGSPEELIIDEMRTANGWYGDRYKKYLPSEGPRHHVRITRPFYLGTYNVTQWEYERVMGDCPNYSSEFGRGPNQYDIPQSAREANPNKPPHNGTRKKEAAAQDTKRFPVTRVAWAAADIFCRKLSELPPEKAAGRSYRLPSEAQWEYACRAGSTGRYSFATGERANPKENNESSLADYAWCAENSGPILHPVGLKKANPWGLYDMHGNVQQWCQDWWSMDYYRKSPTDDPSGPSGGVERVFRGGSSHLPARLCRSAARDSHWFLDELAFVGLRVALVIPTEQPVEQKTIAGNDGRAFVERGETWWKTSPPEQELAEYRKAVWLEPMQYTEAYLRELKDPAGKLPLDQIVTDFRQLLQLRAKTDPVWLRWVSCWLPAVTRGADRLSGIVFASDIPWVRATCGHPGMLLRNSNPGREQFRIAGLPYDKGIYNHAFPGATPADVAVDISERKFATFKAQVGLPMRGGVRFQVILDGKVRYKTRVMRYDEVESISMDVTGTKEIVLRVLNDGGSGNDCDSAIWGNARFIQAGAEDPLEEPSAEFQSATEANAAMFLAEVHWRLDEKALARRWFDKADAWMVKNKTAAEKLRTARSEAAKLLGVAEKPIPSTREKAKAEEAKPKTDI